MRRKVLGRLAGLATLGLGSASSLGHILRYDFLLLPDQVVPYASSEAFAVCRLTYNHHAYNFTNITIDVYGLKTSDLVGVGPNDVACYAYSGDRGLNGTESLDFVYWGAVWTDTSLGMRMSAENVFFGGDQVGFFSDWQQNDLDLQDGLTYVQIHTRSWPGGELRGQAMKLPGLPCRADLTADGFLTGDDFDIFVRLFEVGDLFADYDLDGFVTGDDFDAFVVAFALGC